MQIPKRSSNCIADEKKWQPDCEYISLIWSEHGCWQREDYCCDCWKSLHKEKSLPKDAFFWKSKFVSKIEKPINKNIHDTAIQLFYELILQQSDSKMLFVLALYLERTKQIVKHQEVKNRKAHYVLYEIPEKEETFSIPIMQLTEMEIRAIYEKLTVLFGC